ncbi:hypothetical protein F1D59_16915 [Streptomyces sp. INR7]|nr:hypothetical protein F1D59_16915 [Streptomyces sp. INR7]RST16451.1 hypothetical protein EF904_01660 [Streptomyces sp. WAC05950]
MVGLRVSLRRGLGPGLRRGSRRALGGGRLRCGGGVGGRRCGGREGRGGLARERGQHSEQQGAGGGDRATSAPSVPVSSAGRQ